MRNPLISGFHPDPSIVSVGQDYYLANSTFEYLPGIPIFHSRDLEHFELLTHMAVRHGQLDVQNAATGGGAWPRQSGTTTTGSGWSYRTWWVVVATYCSPPATRPGRGRTGS